ncbi:MAG: hypothetical protein AB7T27_09435 [Kiritimatiellia bacterium]
MNRAALLMFAATLSIAFCAWSANAQLIADPVGITEVGYFEGGGMLMRSTIEYEEEEITRNIVGGYCIYGLNDYIDIYGSLGISASVEPEGWDDSGHGYIFAGGMRGFIWGDGPLSIYAYGQLQYLAEDYGEYTEKFDDGDIYQEATVGAEASLIELITGVMAEYALSEQFMLYGGLELIPISDGEAEASMDYDLHVDDEGMTSVEHIVAETTEAIGYEESYDVKRDLPAVVRGGARFNIGNWFIRGEIALGGETAFGIGAGIKF